MHYHQSEEGGDASISFIAQSTKQSTNAMSFKASVHLGQPSAVRCDCSMLDTRGFGSHLTYGEFERRSEWAVQRTMKGSA